MLPCSWQENYNISCPCCGIQRSFWALMKGEFLLSFQLFPALIALFFVLFCFVMIVFFKKTSYVKPLVWSFGIAAVVMFFQFLTNLAN